MQPRLVAAACALAALAGGSFVSADRAVSSDTESPGRSYARPRYSDWSAPRNLGWPVNTAALDGCPFIAKNNRTLLFATNREPGSGPTTELYYATRPSVDQPWGEPESLGPDINVPGADDFCPTLTTSGRYLYFVSNRPGGCGGNDIYVARRLDKRDFTAWAEPENLGCLANSPSSDITPSLFEDDDGIVSLYFSSNRPGGIGGADIYVSVQEPDGSFGAPVLAPGLNTTFNDQRPNIRVRDGLEIFFESNRPGSLAGSLDLWTATRDSTAESWSAPEHLGATVNSTAVDGRASLSFNGTELYFMSNRPGGFGDQDVYVVERTKLRGLPKE